MSLAIQTREEVCALDHLCEQLGLHLSGPVRAVDQCESAVAVSNLNQLHYRHQDRCRPGY